MRKIRKHFAAVRRLPPEKFERQMVGVVPIHFLRYEIIDSGFLVNLRKLPVVAERIRIPPDAHIHSEFVAEIALANEQLTHQRFAVGHVQVRFDPHPADHFPPPLLHPILNFAADRRIFFAHPFAIRGGRLSVGVLRIFVHQLQRGGKSVVHHLHRFSPGPQPRCVNVRVSRESDGSRLQVGLDFFQFCLRANQRGVEGLLLSLRQSVQIDGSRGRVDALANGGAGSAERWRERVRRKNFL